MIGIASIAPVILIITKNEILDTNQYALKIKELTNFDNNTLTIFFVSISAALIVLNILSRVLSTWGDSYVSNKIWHFCVCKLYNYYLNKPYNYHIQNTSNELLEKITVRANDGIYEIISSSYIIIGSFFSLIFITTLLFLVDYKITLILSLMILVFYLTIYLKLKKTISSFGKFMPDFSKKVFKITSQSFRSIKDIKVFKNYSFYEKKFFDLQDQYRKKAVQMSLVNITPRSIFEMIAFLTIYSLILFFLFFKSAALNEIILILGIFAVSLQRVIPAYQNFYQGISSFKVALPSFEIIYEDLKNACKTQLDNKESFDGMNIKLRNNISFKNINFRYLKDNKGKILDIQNLEIQKKGFIGITGLSGAGKSTFIDIFCGLLEPDKGEIFIDDLEIKSKSYKNISSKIAYVSQFPFIADDTLINNIALGEVPEKIDIEKVKSSCELVGIKDFIEKGLSEKYDTNLGEDGIKLSGGQRQRICIARAIYREKDILIFDEATNSLDQISEKKIMLGLKNKFKKKLILFITHRTHSLKLCDEVLVFDKGKINFKGNYEKLKTQNLSLQ